jgi:hypothetical protein
MNRFVALAGAVALAATLSVVAKADYHYGPLKEGNQCWNKATSNGHTNGGFGYWSECPKPASATVAPRRARNSSKQ